jgi:hypothetical protein
MRLSSFAGLWEVERDIDDLRERRRGRFSGTAAFTPAGDGLAYVERGVLRLPDQPQMTAERRYVWRETADGRVEVRFEDGRFFHSFAPSEPDPEAQHDCPPDHYQVSYDFRAWPHWRARWRVFGPRKDYEMVSWFRRAEDEA